MVEGQYPPHKHIGLFVEWLLTDTIHEAHIEALLVLLLDYEVVYALFEVVGGFLLPIAEEEVQPVHQFVGGFVGGVDG